MIKAKWQSLEPKTKRFVLIGAVAGIAALGIGIVSEPSSSPKRSTRQDVIKHVLTDKDTRSVGLESLAADLKALRTENLNLRREVDRLARDLDNKSPSVVDPSYKSEFNALKSDVQRLLDLTPTDKETQSADPSGDADSVVAASAAGASGGDTPLSLDSLSQGQDGLQIDPKNPEALFANSRWPAPSRTAAAPTADAEASGAQAPKLASGVIKRHVEVSEAVEEDTNVADDDTLFLPAGSIITGTFLNGIDAPTGQGAKRDPFPATLRIQKEAILPNRFRADIRECFLIVSGYGDLSSERAYLRGETISCVREDGGVIESSLDSYAVGEDGKAGVRGRLVSKQGQIIAKSLMAGFLSGVSKAFDVKPVPVIDTRNRSSNTQFQRNDGFSANWAQSAAVSGVSDALDRIADFYLEMAEGMFPVIEVDAGRQIDVFVSRGTNLQIRSKSPNSGARANNTRN